MSGGRHLVVYWHPHPTAEEREEAAAWARTTGTAVDIVVESSVEAAAALATSSKHILAALVAKAGTSGTPDGVKWLIDTQSKVGKHVFTILFSHTVSRNAAGRLSVMDRGVCMVSHRPDEVATALKQLTCYPVLAVRSQASSDADGGYKYTCPSCNLQHLDAHNFWVHMPLFHVGEKKAHHDSVRCPVCNEHASPLVVHVFEKHAPPRHKPDESRSGIALYSFGLVVVQRQRDKKFLVVQEYGCQGYWLPGGGIDAGEMPTTAALRECVEEVGVRVKLTGVLRIEISPRGRYIRQRYIFYGVPEDENDCEPKTLPDFESAGACWVTAEEVRSGAFRLRGEEPLEWFNYVDRGGKIHDIGLIDHEGAPAPAP
jgi:8-oxo-dGTP pyrophosphatase MutT (NUDIX family)